MTSQPDQQAVDAVTVTRVDWAPVPRVNLLPPEILEARGFRKIQFRLGAAVVATLALAAGGTVWAQTQVDGAQEALDATTAQTAVLHRQEARYAEVPKLTTALASAKAAREAALGRDLLWYRMLTDIALSAPSNVWLTTLSVSLENGSTGAGAGAAASGGRSPSGAQAGDPLVPRGIGKVTVTGTATTYPDVAAWLEAVVRVHGLDGSTLQTVTRANASGSGGGLQFTSQIVVMESALSHRFDRKAG